MSGTVTTAARQLAERHFDHPLSSAFIDLDPSRFATAGARATEVIVLDGFHDRPELGAFAGVGAVLRY
jgi:hypothetical protein